MTLEVGHADQDVSHMDITGDGDCFEEGFVNPYVHGTISPKAIGNENGRIDDRIGKPMLIGSGQMGDGLLPHPSIEGVRISQEGLPLVFLHAFHHPPQEDGTHKGSISLFPEMEFNGYEILFADLPFQIGPIQENTQFVEDGLSARTQVCKVDLSLHF
jgi:hypothetical protein